MFLSDPDLFFFFIYSAEQRVDSAFRVWKAPGAGSDASHQLTPPVRRMRPPF